jgi:hypothetical protein
MGVMAVFREARNVGRPAIWLMVLGLALPWSALPASAQEAGSSPVADRSSPAQDGTEAARTSHAAPATSLPTSIDRIKRDLERAESGEGLRGLNQTPHFKVQVVETSKPNWVPKFSDEDFSSPAVPGGNYAYELQQLMFPKTRDPLAQPYAAFSQGELLTVSLTTLLQQLLTPKVLSAVQQAQRAHNEEAARAELARALAEYCAAQPDNGAGIFGCDGTPAAPLP